MAGKIMKKSDNEIMEPKLSKSQYVKGLQCPKSLWFYRNRKDLAPEVDPALQARFDAGHEIGILAQQYFPDGVEVTEEYWNLEGAAQSTEQYIKDGHEVIFEAMACHPVDGSYSRIDILRKVPDTDEWELIEVKGSTSVKDYHIDDLALQYHAFDGAGYKIRRCFMMLIDNQYIRDSGSLQYTPYYDAGFKVRGCYIWLLLSIFIHGA